MKKNKTIWFLVIIGVSCLTLYFAFRDKGAIDILQLDSKDLTKYYNQYNLGDSLSVAMGLELGGVVTYLNSDTSRIIIKKEKTKQENYSKTSIDVKDKLAEKLKEFYLFYPEEMAIKKFPLLYNKLPASLQRIIIQYGYWAPLCMEISSVTSEELKNKMPEIYHTSMINLNLNTMEHVISGIYYKEQGKEYAVGIDFQNGFMGPVYKKTKKPLTTTELKKRLKERNFEDLTFYFLDKETLLNKKTYIPTEYPKNLLPDGRKLQIFKTKSFNRYKAYRKTYSPHYYLFFYLGLESADSLIANISRELAINPI